MFEAIVNPIFSPLLKLNPLLGIAIISFVLTLLITLIHKFATNQEVMKGLKKDMKDHQDEMKKHKDNPSKVMEIQKKVMEKNMEFMKHSFKPMIFTFIPIIIIFGWLNAHMAFYPIMPGQEFDVKLTFDLEDLGKSISIVSVIPEDQLEIINGAKQTIEQNKTKTLFSEKWVGMANWKLKGPEGIYTLVYSFDDDARAYEKDLIITTERKYAVPEKRINDGSSLKSIKIMNEPIKPLFGLGWIWTYIIFSMVFSMIIRKVLNVA
ncbi:hypothetical protein COY26_02445 [Candidatus Woesearchaeota archaeon CG_4_10_14_0_2_um_filter_33_10]|nr:MAG: hypothetical protein AUJ83_03295 [Candidatus Woesearchaeota archaeon CG1_02_33_12]PIN78369.1 MAG: hypothetical protein COV14_03975 [Candidatus Woesearchaeota archaeon CG10_big_fil_rev_8_21_14_0_10_33_12]PIZ53266.1 MAG: hypothetical protein COY26_02445 [Candidatus Woesearchaeota archaeon CG_4_10_14_0_2_um_filter_33_10]